VADLQELLRYLAEIRGSDLYVKVGSAPHVRVDGKLHPTPFPAHNASQTEALADSAVPARFLDTFRDTGEVAFALSVPGVGRFRTLVYRQRGSAALVFRRVVPGLPSWDRLGLPPVVERLIAEHHGLIVVSGTAGSGKTTSLNALVDLINETRSALVVTIEDPIEFLHADKRAMISQREVGTDVASTADAVRGAVRQSPDVLVISEIADEATAQAALTVASGHMVMTALPTGGAIETVQRLIDFFPPVAHHQVRQNLVSVLRGVVSQRLVERADGKGRIAAVEVLTNTPKVEECLLDGERDRDLLKIMADGEYHGMQTMDQALFALFKDGLVSLRDALAAARAPEDLRIAMQTAGLSPAY
jgi:twitching motility protein PilT